MPEFKFEFQKVLQVREIREDLAQNEFLLARKEKKEIQSELRDLNSRQENIYNYLRNTDLDVEEIIQARDYLHNNRLQIKEVRQKLLKKEKKVAEKKEQFVEKRKRRRVLDNLKEKDTKKFQKELVKKEQKQIDEVAVSYYSGGLT